MEGYLSGLLRPPPVPPAHAGGHPGPPPGPTGLPPGGPRPLHPSLSGGPSPWGTGAPAGLPGLPPSLGHPYSSLYADSLVAQAQQQHDLYAREAARAQEFQKELDMHRLVETQRIESLRAAEARANSFLNPYSKDTLSSLLPPPPGNPFAEQAALQRERDIRERTALGLQSAFSMGALGYAPNPLLQPPTSAPHPYPHSSFPPGPPNHGPPAPAPPPSVSTSLYSPSSSQLTSPNGPRGGHSAPHSRGSSPFLPPAPPLGSGGSAPNNSSLSEKLKLGFRDKSPIGSGGSAKPPMAFSPSTARPSSRETSPSPHKGLRGATSETNLQDTTINLSSSPASLGSTLVTNSPNPGLNFRVVHTGTTNLSKVPPSPPSWKNVARVKQEDDSSDIQIIEEEEEVLVDDFDGQCCRTYPLNHSKIQRWREERQKKEKEKKKEEEAAKHLANVQNIKINTSSPEKHSVKQNDTITTSAGSIPVGIVSARQRVDQEKQPIGLCPTSSLQGPLRGPSGPREVGALPLPPSGPLVSGMPATVSGMGPSTWSSGPPPPWALAGQPPPPGPPQPSPWSLPQGHPMAMGQMAGPIPMGYQLAKDPMTGQILLIPTDHTAPQAQPPLWPGFDSPGPLGPQGLLPGQGGHQVPTSSASQHLHHLMIQQQQHLQYMQHQDSFLQHQMQRHAANASFQSTRQSNKVPETITVSDDEDEDQPKKSVTPECRVKEIQTPVESKSPGMGQLQIKKEILKAELKTEIIVTDQQETLPQSVVGLRSVVDDLSKEVPGVDLSQETMNIKQEQPSLSCEEPVVYSPSVNSGCEIATTEALPCLTENIENNSSDSLLPSKSEEPTTLAPPTATVKREVKSELPDTDPAFCEDTKLCAETLLFMSECSTPLACNENFTPAIESFEELATFESGNEISGFDILFQGIELLASGKCDVTELSPIQTLSTQAGLDLLCLVTRNDTFEYGLSEIVLSRDSKLDLGLLCAITAEDYQEQLNWVDPLVKMKEKVNVIKYWSEKSEKNAKDYIARKIKQFTKDHPDNVEEEKYDNIKALAKMVKKIKNMEIMSQLEVDLRLKITELQNNYREKQKTLSRLKTPKKRNIKNKKGKQRGPGRPKKKKFPNPKSKMGRPRKHPKAPPKSEFTELTADLKEKVNIVDNEEEEREAEEQEESFPDSDAPPVLEPQQQTDDMENYGSTRNINSLLKPPRLTASSPPPHQRVGTKESPTATGSHSVTNEGQTTTLSTLKSKFMKGKVNPFANLLSKLAGGPSDHQSGPSDDIGRSELLGNLETRLDNISENASLEDGLEIRSSSEKSSDDSSSETGSMMSPTRDSSFQFGKTSKLGYGLEAYRHSQKRKADKPKKNSGGSSETIVPKKPKNLFMMMDFQRGFNTKSAEDEYNFDEHEEDELNDGPHPYEYTEPRKASPTPSIKSQESHYQEWTDDDIHSSLVKRKRKKSKSPKSKGSKKKRSPSICQTVISKEVSEQFESLRSARLCQTDLKDGLRLLMLQDGKFWPARLNSTKLPDVYGVVMDRQRGNRPLILPRDDILKEAVLELRPKSVSHLPVGARVCAVWSAAYICLFPGTVSHPDEPLPDGHVLVELDDGDSRLVEMTKIRMLPPDYNRVVYDPDPIASLRKRRVSTDSHDSGASHGELHHHRSHDLPSNQAKRSSLAPSSSKLVDTSFPQETKKKSKGGGEGKLKKKHKKCHKHGHHHCHKHSHKHKRHKSGGEAGAPRKALSLHSSYPDQQKFAIRSPPHASHIPPRTEEQEADSSEASQEESDQQNSSDEEGGPVEHRPPHPDLAPLGLVGKGRVLWQWAGEGYKRPGGKGKSKKLFFRSIQRGKDVLHVNDCAVFLSTGRSDRPYIGKIEMLWETGSGSMMVKVKWFYHPEEIETCGRKFDLKLPGGLFQSPHTDENSVHTISHKCEVNPIKEYTRLLQQDEEKKKRSLSLNAYYLAGSYDPAGLTVHFQPGVLKSTDSD